MAANAVARTYYLPDYQDGIMSHERINDSEHNNNGVSCSAYGYYSAADRPSGAECTRASILPLTLECYKCSNCSASFTYDSSNCSGNYVTSGESCGGKYAQCICNPNLFPTSSSGNGCPEGQKADLTSSCTNKSDTNTVYKCENDVCYGLTSKTDCEAAGKYCALSSQCDDSCEQCVELCEGYKTYEGAVDTCSEGCAPGKSISGCPNLCKAGGCKTCSPCPADYDLSFKPGGNFTYETCNGCNDVVMYKITGCMVNYEYWCDVPTCVDLGYKQNISCASERMKINCPLDSTYAICL